MKAHTEFSGRYELVKRKVYDLDGSVQSLKFSNIITDIGLERWATGSIGSRCQIGSGNSTPAVTDTGLQSTLATTTQKVTIANWLTYSVAERWTEVTICYRFTPGITLNSIAEVGIGWDGGLWSRSLIKDAGGNPTTIQLLSDEVLDVYYTLRMQFPATDATGSITLDGVTYDWVMRPANIQSVPAVADAWFSSAYGKGTMPATCAASTDAMTAVNSRPAALTTCDTVTPAAYTAGSKTQRITYVFALGTANFGIKTVSPAIGEQYVNMMWQLGFYQGGAPVAVPKTSSKRLTLTFDFSWGRA